MTGSRKFSPSEVLDEGWALVVLYLTLLPDASETLPHLTRVVFNCLRRVVKSGTPWR